MREERPNGRKILVLNFFVEAHRIPVARCLAFLQAIDTQAVAHLEGAQLAFPGSSAVEASEQDLFDFAARSGSDSIGIA